MAQKKTTRSVPAPPADRPASPAAVAASAPPAGRLSERQLDWIMGATAVVLAVAVFLGTVHGDWIYDDEQLILANSLVQTPGQVWTSLTSDVFAYKSTTGEPNSPYWRPATAAWFIVHHRLYGLESTLGWHLGSIAVHAVVTLLAFLVMRRLGLRPLLAGAAAWIFAVHPTRVESVVWISGIPDLLIGAGLLGSLWFVLAIVQRRERAAAGVEGGGKGIPWGLWAGALGCYGLALASKEFAILFALLVFAAGLRWRESAREGGGVERRLDLSSWRSAAALTLPFLAMAAVYLYIRAGIVAPRATPEPLGGVPLALKSAPITGAYYLRQMVLPYSIGPTYPASPVREPTLTNFVLPGLLVAGVGLGMLWLAVGRAGSRAALCGLTLFLVAIAPAPMAAAVSPQLMVQDRYLYLPLLGFLIVALYGVRSVLARRAGSHRGEAMLALGAAVVCIPLAAQTFRYGTAWTGAEKLWSWATRHNPESAYAWSQYGVALTRAGKYEEAAAALDEANARLVQVQFIINRAELSIRMGRYDEAEPMLRRMLEFLQQHQPTIELYRVTDLLVRVYLLRDRDVDAAARYLRDVRERLPNFRAMITDRLAYILIVDGRREEALAELEAVRPYVATDRSQESRWVLYRLGQLYAERGRLEEAEGAFLEFLRQTEGTGHARMMEARELAQEAIAVIRRGPVEGGAAENGAPSPTDAPVAPPPG